MRNKIENNVNLSLSGLLHLVYHPPMHTQKSAYNESVDGLHEYVKTTLHCLAET